MGNLIPTRLKAGFKKMIGLVASNQTKNGVKCLVCGSFSKAFAAFGDPVRENARCTKCGSLERHRLIWSYLNNQTNLVSGKKIKVLHFAPEKIFFRKFIAMQNVEYVPCDLFPELFRFDTEGKIAKVDITSIPYSDNHFDVILCNHVLEHIPDDQLAMKELYRVMKAGGWGIFQVPIDYSRERTYEDFAITGPIARKAAFGQDDHVRWYGRDYSERLRDAGFHVDVIDYVASFLPNEIAKYGFMKTELIYQCRK